jgi:hypothetical protein
MCITISSSSTSRRISSSIRMRSSIEVVPAAEGVVVAVVVALGIGTVVVLEEEAVA